MDLFSQANLQKMAEVMPNQLNLNQAELITVFLFKLAQQTHQSQMLETAYQFFFKVFDALVVGHKIGVLDALKFYDTVKEHPESATRTIHLNRLNERNWCP